MSHPSGTVGAMVDMPNEQGEYTAPGDIRRLAGKAAIVIDPRLADLWQLVWSRPDEGSVPLGTLAALLRLAYAQGYADAHDEETAGSLYLELGLPAARRGRPRSARRSRRGRAASGNSDR